MGLQASILVTAVIIYAALKEILYDEKTTYTGHTGRQAG